MQNMQKILATLFRFCASSFSSRGEHITDLNRVLKNDAKIGNTDITALADIAF